MRRRDPREAARRRGDDIRRLTLMLILLTVGLAVCVAGTLVENGWVVLVGGFSALLGASGLRLAAVIAVRDDAFSGMKHFIGRSRG